jgi:TPP-dependent indolepyruvate ferredoxin oxidoreductase alpha subunit
MTDPSQETKALAKRDQSPAAVAARRARTNRFVAWLAAMPVLDPRSPNEIMDDLNAL